MTWTAVRKHTNEQLDDYALEMLRKHIPGRLDLLGQGNPAAIDQLDFWYARMLMARGPDLVRNELAPLTQAVAPSVAGYLKDCVGDYPLSSMIFEYSNATNVFEIVGLEVPSDVLASFRPFLLRIDTDRRDMPASHWTKALLSLVLGERSGWAPIAGFLPTQDVPFAAGATFGLNVQGLLGHLGGALLHGASLNEVLPAWRQFMAGAVHLTSARQIDAQVILWTARVVFHQIGGAPLGTVGALLFKEIDALVAAEGTSGGGKP